MPSPPARHQPLPPPLNQATLQAKLKARFPADGRIAVLGIGSELRGDDAAGQLVSETLRKRAAGGRLAAFSGANAPENVTGEIVKFAPAHVVLVDAADIGAAPGAVQFIEADEVKGASFSTHTLPMPVIVGYLVGRLGCGTTLIGIQPANLEVLAGVTPSVQAAVDALVEALVAVTG